MKNVLRRGREEGERRGRRERKHTCGSHTSGPGCRCRAGSTSGGEIRPGSSKGEVGVKKGEDGRVCHIEGACALNRQTQV